MAQNNLKKGSYVSIYQNQVIVGEIKEVCENRCRVQITVSDKGKEKCIDVWLDKRRLTKISEERYNAVRTAERI